MQNQVSKFSGTIQVCLVCSILNVLFRIVDDNGAGSFLKIIIVIAGFRQTWKTWKIQEISKQHLREIRENLENSGNFVFSDINWG